MARTLLKVAGLAIAVLVFTRCSATPRDDCQSITCSGRGSCKMHLGEPLCLCHEGYAGANCDTCAIGYHDDGSGNCLADAQDVCQTYTCAWHGSCDDSTGQAVCTCDPGYTGTFCTTCATDFHPDGMGNCLPNDECRPGYCSGHGTCLIVGGVPVCECDQDYTGEFCENQRCQSNQDCTDLIDAFCFKVPGNCQGTGICQAMPDGCFGVEELVCGCDQVTYSNKCYANSAGVNLDYEGECRLITLCQSITDCPEADSYCAKDPGNCDGQGECKPRLTGCPGRWEPVCGCNDLTYQNACLAAADGVNVAHDDICDPATIDCRRNLDCGSDYSRYCKKDVGDCLGTGSCEDRPLDCTSDYEPVCGCNGRTYTNPCQAASAQVNVDYQGECVVDPCHTDSECDSTANQFCAKPPGACDGPGLCLQKPPDCPPPMQPVCGCNGQTYDGVCLAALEGVNVDYQGVCQPPPCYNNHECTGSGSGEVYCANDLGDCFGQGICLDRPGVCPEIADPVCGCDQKDYGNPCEAAMAGVNIMYFGPCQQGITLCSNSQDCTHSGMYCAKGDAECTGSGVCAHIPSSCIEIYNPMCGCDGATYFNRCQAAQSGVSVEHVGGC